MWRGCSVGLRLESVVSAGVRRRNQGPIALRDLGWVSAQCQLDSRRRVSTQAAVEDDGRPWNAVGRWAGLACELSKIRLSTFVASTALAGYAASGAPLLYFDGLELASGAVLTTAGVLACSGAANALNQLLERSRDAKMARTARRPLPSGRCSAREAACFAAAASTVGGAMLFTAGGPVPAALGLGNIVAYAGVYTCLKPRSELNTWVGAVVGAVPPLIGWAAAGESLLFPIEPWLLGLSIYLWQFPHFFALAWRHRADYARGGFAMIPCNDPDGDRTAALISRYSIYALSIPLLAVSTGATTPMFAVEAIGLNALLLASANGFEQSRSNANSARVFRVTLVYLPLLLLCFVVHSTRLHESRKNDTALTLTDAVDPLRQLGRSACLHELVAAYRQRYTAPTFCPLSGHHPSVDRSLAHTSRRNTSPVHAAQEQDELSEDASLD